MDGGMGSWGVGSLQHDLCTWNNVGCFYEDDWDQFGVDGDYLASCLALGDNSKVNVEEGNV